MITWHLYIAAYQCPFCQGGQDLVNLYWLSHPGILGVVLCFHTSPYAAAGADFCSRNNFRTTCHISFICCRIELPNNFSDLFHLWQDWWPWYIDDQILVDYCHDLDPEFSRSNMEFAISQPKNYLIATKRKAKHIDWTLGHKCDHQVWPWPWPWPWIFKVKYLICYILRQNDPIATKWKMNLSIEHWVSNVTISFDFGHDLNLEFS